ncbi:hypothetical protein SAY87_019497 [Trapa incisa]|uniref:FAF domain-containing protein n=1 Tax=Trapa incisa TaxID=236973 RepID=A0AAN7K4Q1_9MYRT|nr:hypothetical protein SAY87_019497 [Trapa incisa]
MGTMAASMKQGIKSIFPSDGESSRVESLRKTLSASISSCKWVAQNGLNSENGEDTQSKSRFDVWNSVQEQSNDRGCVKAGQPDNIWNSILSTQKIDQHVQAAPYIHSFGKRSERLLSAKSLQICTESLGSETGSDGFSSFCASLEDNHCEDDKEESQAISYKKRNLQPLPRSRSFLPPLPSLSRQSGSSLQVRSRRDNGRLVLEAVSVQEQSNFRAQREDGRLVLTFIDDPSSDHGHEDRNKTASFDVYEEEEEEEEDNQETDMETEEARDADVN